MNKTRSRREPIIGRIEGMVKIRQRSGQPYFLRQQQNDNRHHQFYYIIDMQRPKQADNNINGHKQINQRSDNKKHFLSPFHFFLRILHHFVP